MSLSRKKKPLYLQIKSILKDRILHGIYPIGQLIPSEPQLEQEFGVSKITVRGAIQELVQEGYLEKGSGKGTKVVRNTSASKLSKGKSFTEVLVENGHTIRKRLIRAEKIRNEPETEPYRLFGDACFCIERIYDLDGAPYIHYTHYLSVLAGEIDRSDLDSQSLYGLLEERDIALEQFKDQFAVAVAPAAVADKLNVQPSTPLLRRSRRSYEESGNMIEYSVGYYNTEIQSYLVNYDA
ncbi:GntR family transcriptional regulator [Paenibacillaceae bacterium WGS1546]|uniref:GntR family transcriptional regulator n=1 Tax=Cohnella sp. WGS1546 TaxID=3366810 RepID=UPI00372D7FDB